jgi:hypothetical protein
VRHLESRGHISLSDGSVIRLDLELNRWVASYYRADHTLRAYSYGRLERMATLIDLWQAAMTSPHAGVVNGPGRCHLPVRTNQQHIQGKQHEPDPIPIQRRSSSR